VVVPSPAALDSAAARDRRGDTPAAGTVAKRRPAVLGRPRAACRIAAANTAEDTAADAASSPPLVPLVPPAAASAAVSASTDSYDIIETPETPVVIDIAAGVGGFVSVPSVPSWAASSRCPGSSMASQAASAIEEVVGIRAEMTCRRWPWPWFTGALWPCPWPWPEGASEEGASLGVDFLADLADCITRRGLGLEVDGTEGGRRPERIAGVANVPVLTRLSLLPGDDVPLIPPSNNPPPESSS